MAERAVVLSLVERGWQAARECSLDAQRHGLCVVHLIKGRLDRSVRALIAPQPGVHLISATRNGFWPAAWLMIVWLTGSRRLHSVLVDNDRTLRRLHGWACWLRLHLIMVREGAEGYELWVGHQQVSRTAWQTAGWSRSSSAS
jgi:hypothetical protein